MNKQVLIAVAVLVGVVVFGVVGWVVFGGDASSSTQRYSSNNTADSDDVSDSKANFPNSSDPVTEIYWEFTGESWKAVGDPPECPDPLIFNAPVDVSLATSMLYPGQTRGGNYKPHGGFRFDTIEDNAVVVRLPMDAVLVDAARYLVDGETQYMFDFIAPCGLKFRMGHLLTLDTAFMKIAETLPTAQEGDSRTTRVYPGIAFKEGELIATAVGVRNGQNTFVDFGVYDLRSPNAISSSASWAAAHADDRELAWHGICWLENLLSDDARRVQSLPPADPQSGATSDYCQ